MHAEEIAKVCHEANRALCEAAGDNSQKPWGEAEQWQQESAIAGVKWRLDNMDMPNSAQHDEWCRDKADAGWVYGDVKDSEKKTHPCLVPYEQLPRHQQLKDALFVAIVKALAQ